MAKFFLGNPATSRSKKSLEGFDIPDEGEVFRLSGGTGKFAVRKGDQILQFDPRFSDPSKNFGLNDLTSLRQAAFSPQDVGATGNLREFSIGILGDAFGGRPRGFATKDMFQGLTRQTSPNIVDIPDPTGNGRKRFTTTDNNITFDAPAVNLEQKRQTPLTAQSGASVGAAIPDIPFRPDLPTTANKASIENLVATKPVSTWNIKDKENWNYATGNAPLPQNDATLISPTGQKEVVIIGSQRANDLFKAGYSLGGGTSAGGDIITPTDLTTEDNISIDGATKRETKYPSSSPGETVETSKHVSQNILDYVNRYYPDTPTERETNILTDEVNKLIGETSGREAFLQQQLEKEGVREKRQQLLNINNEINIKTAALNKRLAEIDASPMTQARTTGAKAEATRIAQADIMFLQSQAQAMMNNIKFAKEMAQSAVDAKYNPILEQITIKSDQLKLLEGRMNREEAKYANALKLMLADQEQAFLEQKGNEQAIQDIKLKAISSGITDASVLDRIGKAESVDEALQILGTSMPQEVVGGGIELTNDFKNFQLAGGEAGTGMTFAQWQGKEKPKTPGEQSDYLTQTALRAIQSVDELLPQVSGNTTGWGAFFKNKLPTTEARTFAAQLDTLKSNIAFGALTAMREASKTGGALGQVSDREGKLLESTLGALDQLQSADQLTGQLNKIKESIQRWNSAIGATENTNMSDFTW